jgi:bifunctional non-homologous end joining protein LigD
MMECVARRESEVLRVPGGTVQITNPGKLLFPAAGVTKREIIEYYVAVAPFLLPHFKHRPVTLKRYPDGVTGQKFYEKDKPSYTPDWVPTIPVWRRSGESQIHYVVINNVRTLAWCAQIASIELHPFLHRARKLEQPTSVVFDLDPGEGATILECAQVAFWIRDVLAAQQLTSFVKVSGSKGLQIYVPLNTPTTYDVTQPFARVLADRLEREHPKLVIAKMAKTLRVGKVFIDWSQNADHKTTVGVYSMRAKRERPFISMPITWQELQQAQKRGDAERLYWSPDAALGRLEKLGDLFAPVLTLKQRLPDADERKRPATKSIRSTKAPPDRPAVPAVTFVPPMTASLAETVPRGAEWIYEVKLDGYRAIATKHLRQVRLYSRKGNDFTADYPAVAKAVGSIPADSVVLDGEIVALDAEGRPSFQALQHRANTRHPVAYYAFDLLHLNGNDLRKLPLEERKRRLAAAVAQSPVHLSENLPGDPDEIVTAIQRLGLEGVIAKRRHSPYRSVRSGDWIKVKFLKRQEFVIGAYKPGPHNFESLTVGYYDDDGKLWFAGKVRNGYTPKLRADLWRHLKPLSSDTYPFADKPSRSRSHWGEGLTTEDLTKLRWLKPVLVAEVGFVEWTKDGKLRHPTFIGLRFDKEPREVVREVPARSEGRT